MSFKFPLTMRTNQIEVSVTRSKAIEQFRLNQVQRKTAMQAMKTEEDSVTWRSLILGTVGVFMIAFLFALILFGLPMISLLLES